jgi:hypothetical protein
VSTYGYLVCLDHEPPIISRDESTQHRHTTSEMDRLRDWIARREALVDALNRDELDLSEYFLRNTVWLLREHPRCRYAARDEYGEWVDLGWGTPERPRPPVEHQTWERPHRPPAPGDRVASIRVHLDVDARGRASVHEAVLAQLFHDAGWERTA